MIRTISAFENMAFGLDEIISMKDCLDQEKAMRYLVQLQINALETKHGVEDYAQYIKLLAKREEIDGRIQCYTENIWPELSLTVKNAA